MSVGSIGVEGYPDDQTLGTLDDVALLNLSGVTFTGAQRFPASPADVSHYQALAGLASVALAPTTLNFDYFLDPAGATFLGSRGITLDPNVSAGAQFHVPNLGPHVQAHYTVAAPGTQFTPALIAYPTNRVGGLDLPDPSNVLQTWVSVALGAGGSFTRWFLSYHDGPARLWISADVAGCTWQLNYQQTSGTPETFDEGQVGVGIVGSVAVLLPARACQIIVTNTGAGVAHVSGTIVGSTTGAL